MQASQQAIADLRPTVAECRAERLVQMRDAFLAGGLYTVEELAARFCVSTDTIYRDLRSISRYLNAPLVCESRWGLMRQ